jgi:SAM-dependent methyltransferase
MSGIIFERMVITEGSYPLFQQHLNRYVFAGQFVKQCTVLDVASGLGYGTRRLLDDGGTLVVGVDISWKACKEARSLYGVNVVTADARRLPFRNLCFGAIVSFETIEHLSRPWDFLAECRRLLESGGKFIISTPNRQMSIFQENPYHIREYRPQEFVDLLQSFFPLIKVYGQMFRLYPLRWLSRVTARAIKHVPGGRRLVAYIQEHLLGNRRLQATDLSLIDESYKVTPVDNLRSVMVQPHFIICLIEV